MNYPVYNIQGKEIDSIVLPKEIFEVELNKDLLYQVVVSQISNKRKTLADTKDRAEVSGGGKKPWRQKGTGRSRHGSSRSPIWKGGGITFGPTVEKNFKKKINKKSKRKALCMILSEKVKNNTLFILDDFNIEKAKTKLMVEVLKNLKISKKTLITTPKKDETVWRASRNIPGVSVKPISDINALEVISSKNIVLSKEGLKALKNILK
jgi:large subunit ribosomal protein L4